MFQTIRLLAVVLLCLNLCSCSQKEPPAESRQNESPDPKPIVPKADPPRAPLVGRPSGSGYTDESIRVQIGPDESLREQHSPRSGRRFLLVRLVVEGEASLVPRDYRIVIDGEQYTPHAVGFGRPNGVYAAVETFVGDQVELAPGSADQLFHNGERIQKSELKNPIVFLVYDVPDSQSPMLWHGNVSFSLHPDYQTLTADLSGMGGTLTAKTEIQFPDPGAAAGDFAAHLLDATRTRIELVGVPRDVIVATVALSASQETTIELKKSDIRLHGSEGRSSGGTVYFHFDAKEVTLTAGSSYTEGETYEDRDLIGLAAGSFRLPVVPGKSVTMTVIFPDPKLAGDLELTLSPSVAVRVPEPDNPLGKFPPPVKKMPEMVAWAPLVGMPTDAGYLAEPPKIAADFKTLASAATADPGDGLRYLQVQFRIDEQSLFVPIDYRLAEQESNTIYRPLAVAFGDTGVYVKGLDYEKIELKPAGETAPEQRFGKLTGWNLKAPTITLLYEIAPAEEFVFIHGDTQFVIEP